MEPEVGIEPTTYRMKSKTNGRTAQVLPFSPDADLGAIANAYASVYAVRVWHPEVLSFREFRSGLAAALKRVQEPGADPVFVGSHRKPEAVMLSVSRYEELVRIATRRADVDEAVASVRAEGLDPGPEGLALLEGVAAGTTSTAQAREQILARYQR